MSVEAGSEHHVSSLIIFYYFHEDRGLTTQLFPKSPSVCLAVAARGLSIDGHLHGFWETELDPHLYGEHFILHVGSPSAPSSSRSCQPWGVLDGRGFPHMPEALDSAPSIK